MSVLTRLTFVNGLRKSVAPVAARCLARNISTSKKNRETTTITPESITTTESKSKNWISYGFDEHDESEDRLWMHAITFGGVTLVFVFGGFLLAYRPDDRQRDWAQREGYLELRRREALGLPLVDPNYLPLDEIKLPTDEELGDTEIVI